MAQPVRGHFPAPFEREVSSSRNSQLLRAGLVGLRAQLPVEQRHDAEPGADERDAHGRKGRHGEGQPLVWRHYANDRSNRDVHSLHPGWTGGQAPDPTFVKKHGAAIRRSADVADTDYGPGVSDATPSALDHLSKSKE